jgi:hypothetical protein
MLKVIAVAAFAAIGAAIGMLILREIPDLQRYQRIRSM